MTLDAKNINMPSKKVALLISSFLPNMGGMEVGLHNIASRLPGQGWTPVIIAPYPHVKALQQQGWSLPYEIEALPPKIWSIIEKWPWLGFKITDHYLGHLNRKHKFDFWHVTMGYPTGCAMVHFAQASKKQIRYLIRCAGEDIQKHPDIGYGMRLNPRLDTIITHYLRKAQCLIAITQSVHDEYTKMGVDNEVIVRVPNGVPFNRFAADTDVKQLRKNMGIKDEDFLILSVGRNHPKKNYKTLISAAAKLHDAGVTGFKVICVGKGCQDLSQQVYEMSLENHVILKEQIATDCDESADRLDLPAQSLVDLYKAADLFAFPSLTETFGIAIVEAMAAGLPVIVGDSEGCRDIVENGAWGMMCQTHDDGVDLADKIQGFIQDGQSLKDYQEKSKQRAKDFDWDNIVRQYASIYEGR